MRLALRRSVCVFCGSRPGGDVGLMSAVASAYQLREIGSGMRLGRCTPGSPLAGRQWRAARSGRPERQRGGRGAPGRTVGL